MYEDRHAPVTVVRPGLIYGPRDTHSFARFARLIEQGKMLLIGPASNHLPLIYVKDAARGIILASEAEQAVGKAYLLVNDEPVTQREYFAAIARELNVPPPNLHIPLHLALALGAASEAIGRVTRRHQPPPLMRFGLKQIGGENLFVTDRTHRELGFSAQVNLAEGVRQSIAWYRMRSCARTYIS
jgi:nucleoside-diphosphate-sugar epimerase